MKLTAILIALTLSMNVSAFGSNQGHSQDQGQLQGQSQGQQMAQGQQMGQGQSLHNRNILAAAASTKTVVDLTSDNSNSLSNRLSNDSYSEGSYSKSNSGALSGSKSRAGDNTNNITIEADSIEYPASTAMSGIASACVSTLAAQSQEYGLSLGGESSDCKALRTALAFFSLASEFQASNPEMAEYYMAQGHYYAKKSGVTGATLFMSEARGFIIDLGISGLILKAGLAAFGIY